MEAKASLFLIRSPCLALSFFLIEGTGHQDPWPPVKSANGTTATQNRAIEKIATLLNQAIEVEIKQAHTGIASQVRGLAEKLEPKSARRAVGRKKVSRRKPVVAKKKSERRRGRVKPTEKAAEQTGTA
jgi:hypothetical protein